MDGTSGRVGILMNQKTIKEFDKRVEVFAGGRTFYDAVGGLVVFLRASPTVLLYFAYKYYVKRTVFSNKDRTRALHVYRGWNLLL